jgi:4,5-DOPA dioxygenase extradiol
MDSQPAVFISHGSPMTALDSGPYAAALAAFGASVQPAAILVISAHWQEPGIRITAAARPELIYDFGGFPRELYQLKYDAPGSPDLATKVAAELRAAGFDAALDDRRGWDHGVWVPLRLMFPEARIPVVEISLPRDWPPQELVRVGEALRAFRTDGALVLGSGGIVHNLRLVNWAGKDAPPEAWAQEFQNWVQDKVERRDLPTLFHYEAAAAHARRAVPTPEHFVPLFPVLGAAGDYTQALPIFEGFEHGTISMYCAQLR